MFLEQPALIQPPDAKTAALKNILYHFNPGTIDVKKTKPKPQCRGSSQKKRRLTSACQQGRRTATLLILSEPPVNKCPHRAPCCVQMLDPAANMIILHASGGGGLRGWGGVMQ